MESIDFDAILRLDRDERIALAQANWDSVGDESASPRLTNAESGEIRRRIAEHGRDPSAAIPWETALRRLRERHG
jgi:putative addiction module component (TIGR02574 family)